MDLASFGSIFGEIFRNENKPLDYTYQQSYRSHPYVHEFLSLDRISRSRVRPWSFPSPTVTSAAFSSQGSFDGTTDKSESSVARAGCHIQEEAAASVGGGACSTIHQVCDQQVPADFRTLSPDIVAGKMLSPDLTTRPTERQANQERELTLCTLLQGFFARHEPVDWSQRQTAWKSLHVFLETLFL